MDANGAATLLQIPDPWLKRWLGTSIIFSHQLTYEHENKNIRNHNDGNVGLPRVSQLAKTT
jgi:hypothetical protein